MFEKGFDKRGNELGERISPDTFGASHWHRDTTLPGGE